MVPYIGGFYISSTPLIHINAIVLLCFVFFFLFHSAWNNQALGMYYMPAIHV